MAQVMSVNSEEFTNVLIDLYSEKLKDLISKDPEIFMEQRSEQECYDLGKIYTLQEVVRDLKDLKSQIILEKIL